MTAGVPETEGPSNACDTETTPAPAYSDLWPTSQGDEWKGNFHTEVVICLIVFSTERFSAVVYPHLRKDHPRLGGSLGTWLHMKREGSRPRVGIWLWQDFGHSLLLIGAVKRICVCAWEKVFVWIQVLLKVWKHIKDKCQTTVGVWGGGGELRGNLHPRVVLYTPHEGKNTELTAADDYLSVLTCVAV